MTLQAARDKVIVRELPHERKRDGLFVLQAADSTQRGVVVSSGIEGVKRGDRVRWASEYCGELVADGDEELLVMQRDDLIAIEVG